MKTAWLHSKFKKNDENESNILSDRFIEITSANIGRYELVVKFNHDNSPSVLKVNCYERSLYSLQHGCFPSQQLLSQASVLASDIAYYGAIINLPDVFLI